MVGAVPAVAGARRRQEMISMNEVFIGETIPYFVKFVYFVRESRNRPPESYPNKGIPANNAWGMSPKMLATVLARGHFIVCKII